MVQLYKKNASGESGGKAMYTLVITSLHIKSSFCGYPTKPCESCKFLGEEGELFSCKASNYWGALPDDWGQGGQMSPSVSFWWKCQSHQSQTLRSMGLVGSHIINNMSDNQGKLWHKKTMANCYTQTKLKWIQRFPLVGYLPHRLQLWDISLPSPYHSRHLHPDIHPALKVA